MAHTLRIWTFASGIIALLVLIVSLLGIFDPTIYAQETANWALQAVGQDIGNVLAATALLITSYFVTRKSPTAYLIWVGTLLYFLYAFMIYVFFIHFNALFLLYVAIWGLSFYTLVGSLWHNFTAYAHQLKPSTSKLPSVVLMAIGSLFTLLWLAEIVPALTTGTLPRSAALAGLWVNPIQVIDLALVLPGMFLAGVFLLRGQVLGRFFAAPWLMFSVLMGSSIVANMVLELNRGNGEAIVPFTMVSAIVVMSAIGLRELLNQQIR